MTMPSVTPAPRTRPRRALVALAAFAALAGLGACSDSKGEEADKTAEATAQTGEAEVLQAEFAQTVVLPGELKLTIGQPAPYTASDNVDPLPEGAAGVVFDVTVENGTNADWDPWTLAVTALSKGEPGPQLYDLDAGVNTPSELVAPGQSATFKVAFQVADPEDVALTATWGGGDNPAQVEFS
jgi:hypothetical protein